MMEGRGRSGGEYDRTTTMGGGKYDPPSTEGEGRTYAADGVLPCHDDDASSHPSNDPDVGDKNQLRQQHERAKNESWLRSYKEKKSSQLAGRANLRLKPSSPSSTTPSLSSPAKGGNFDKSPFSMKLRRVGKGSIGGSPPDGIDDNSDDGGTSTASVRRQRLSWIEALQLKQKSLRLKQVDINQNGSGHGSVDDIISTREGSPIIVGKTLRSLSPRKKSRITPPTTPVGSAAPPWSKVRLRPTPTPTKPTKESSSSPPAPPAPAAE